VPEAGDVQGDVHMHIFDESWLSPWLFLDFGEKCPERVTHGGCSGWGVIARRQSRVTAAPGALLACAEE